MDRPVRPNDDAEDGGTGALAAHTSETRTGVSVSRPAAMSEVGYLRLG